MQPDTIEAPVSLRIVNRDAFLIFGLGEVCTSNAGIPAQWERFVPHLGHIASQVGNTAYGVIHNAAETGGYEYICGVEVREFPPNPPEFTRLKMPAQTYAVFEHRDHISSIGASWKMIWNQALPAAGHAASDGPAFERYTEAFDGRTGLGGVEIWVPVKA